MTENMKKAVTKQAKKLKGTFIQNSFEKSDLFENSSRQEGGGGKEINDFKELKYSEKLSFTNNDSFNNSFNESQNINELGNRVSDSGPQRMIRLNQFSPSKSQAAMKSKQPMYFQRLIFI